MLSTFILLLSLALFGTARVNALQQLTDSTKDSILTNKDEYVGLFLAENNEQVTTFETALNGAPSSILSKFHTFAWIDSHDKEWKDFAAKYEAVNVPSFFVIETPHDYYWNFDGDVKAPGVLDSFLSKGILQGTLAPKVVGYDSADNVIDDDPESLQQQIMNLNPMSKMIIEMKNPYLKALYFFLAFYTVILLTGTFYPPEYKIHQLSEILFKPYDYIIELTSIKEEKEADFKKKD
ncbi:predicted protein [Chaetoceros tenuissimus]|uniref:Thioredoxin domain-containing protein n=1 Tax=Chaetoceros tenuissimus TaxID=426638 RepID=A0AAD3D7W7_9STRA|nr:predicted protein [Chaetoceros tenuissimus]